MSTEPQAATHAASPASLYHPGMYQPMRLSHAAAPWVHAGLQSGSLDAEGVAQDLAFLVDPKADEDLVKRLQFFFENVSSFDASACDLKAATAGNGGSMLDADAAFHYLKIKVLAAEPCKPKPPSQRWITGGLLSLALADQLAWLAQPTKLATEVPQRYTPTRLADRVCAYIFIINSFSNRLLASGACRLVENTA